MEPHTELGQIAAQYNRVLAAIGQRTDSLQLLRRTAAAANESSSVEEALAVALDEVCAFTGWPIGHAFLVSRGDPGLLVSSGVVRITDTDRFEAFALATERERPTVGKGLAGVALEKRKPVVATSEALIGPPTSVTLRGSSRSTRAPQVEPVSRRSSLRWTVLAPAARPSGSSSGFARLSLFR